MFHKHWDSGPLCISDSSFAQYPDIQEVYHSHSLFISTTASHLKHLTPWLCSLDIPCSIQRSHPLFHDSLNTQSLVLDPQWWKEILSTHVPFHLTSPTTQQHSMCSVAYQVKGTSPAIETAEYLLEAFTRAANDRIRTSAVKVHSPCTTVSPFTSVSQLWWNWTTTVWWIHILLDLERDSVMFLWIQYLLPPFFWLYSLHRPCMFWVQSYHFLVGSL